MSLLVAHYSDVVHLLQISHINIILNKLSRYVCPSSSTAHDCKILIIQKISHCRPITHCQLVQTDSKALCNHVSAKYYCY